MMFLFLLLILAGTAAGVWFQGLWSAAVTLVNLLLVMIVATSFYEPICSAIERMGAGAQFTYLLDFIVLWMLFGVVFSVLRAVTDGLSQKPVKFDLPVEMAGRSVLALWCGWLMVCFVAFSLQMAPLNSPAPLGAWASPTAKSFSFVSPDRLWLGFMHSRSRQALGGQPFDPDGEFLPKYHQRRTRYAAPQTGLKFTR
jgi:hypothetical protein